MEKYSREEIVREIQRVKKKDKIVKIALVVCAVILLLSIAYVIIFI
ncbi:MAG: hypothetical protein Q4B60_00970 [Erysipelotrichaceae bacterium]|nr:hypothetical protein [Erysipelotrichaceae bacterium]